MIKPFTAFDCEDNSPEVIAAYPDNPLAGFKRVVTQVAAIASDKSVFYDDTVGCAARFREWLLRDGGDRLVFAHNLQYDLGCVFGDRLDELDFVLVGGRLIKARWNGIEFRDSFNLFPMPLEHVGAAVGLAKGSMDVRSKQYVMRDVEIVRKAIDVAVLFYAENRSTSLKATLGGQCFEVFHGMGLRNWRDTSDQNRQALFGGRVELFQPGGSGLVAYTDINSLYPWAMTREFPVCSEPMRDFESGYGVACVTIEVPEMDVQPLPWRHRDGAVWYPHGTFSPTDSHPSVYTFHEIKNAIKMGCRVKKFHWASGSNEGYAFYKPFVDSIYSKRLKAKTESEKLMLKLLMNNLYGQLAIGGIVTKTMHKTLENFEKYADSVRSCFGSKMLVDVEIPLPEHANYMHAAYVTSYGRLRLYEFMCLVNPCDLIYCDTDSLIFFVPSIDGIPFSTSTTLGEMKLEGFGDACHVHAPKTYTLDGFGADKKRKVAAKGIRRGEQAEQFIRNGEAIMSQPFKLREAVEFFDRDTKAGSHRLSVWHTVKKVRRTTYDKKDTSVSLYKSININTLDKHHKRRLTTPS